LIVKEKNLQKKCRKLQVIKRENYKNPLLLFLGKCTSGSLISVLTLSIDDVSVWCSSTTAWDFFSRLVLEIFESVRS